MIVGEWQLDRIADPFALQKALATAFGVEDDEVCIVSSLMDAPYLSQPHLLCVPTVRSGQFPGGLSLYVKGISGELSETELARVVAMVLGCRCLVPDESLDPYLRYLVSGDGVQLVRLDAEKLDDHDEFWLDSSGVEGDSSCL